MALAIAGRGRRSGQYDEVSLAELEHDVVAHATALANHGIRTGMRTVVMITPGREFCAVVFALLKLGAPPVFIDPGIGLRHVGPCIQNARPAAFIGIRKAQLARRLFGWGAVRFEFRSLSNRSCAANLRRRPSPRAHPKKTQPKIGTLPRSPSPAAARVLPKLSCSITRIFWPRRICSESCWDHVPEQPHLATLPLFLLFAPVLGVPAVIPDMDPSRPAAADPSRLVAAIDDYRCTSTFASPALVRRLGSYCRETKRKLSSIERVLSAGAPSDPNALATLAAAIAPGGEVFTPYGATEALPVSNISCREILAETGEKTRRGAGVCVGRPLGGITASIIPIGDSPIRDWSDVPPLPRHEIGEIAVSGPVVSRRYFNNPGATALAKIPCRLDGAFYHRMGDVGYLDDLGRLWMCGRKSQRVVTPRRVYFTVPAEGVFNGHPEVARTALVGVNGRGALSPHSAWSLQPPNQRVRRSELRKNCVRSARILNTLAISGIFSITVRSRSTPATIRRLAVKNSRCGQRRKSAHVHSNPRRSDHDNRIRIRNGARANRRLAPSPQRLPRQRSAKLLDPFRHGPPLRRERVDRTFNDWRRGLKQRMLESIRQNGQSRIVPLPRVKNLDRKTFIREFVNKSHPVVFEGAARDWDCCRKWNFDWIKQQYGDDDVMLVDHARQDRNPLQKPIEHLTLGDLIDGIDHGSLKYARFHPLLQRHPELRLDLNQKWLKEHLTNRHTSWLHFYTLFLGGKGTDTAIHNAGNENMFVQIQGQKKWRFYPVEHSPIFDPPANRSPYKYTGYRPDQPDDELYPMARHMDWYETVLEPGDVLYNPPYYWHHVSNPTSSIGVGCRWNNMRTAVLASPVLATLEMFNTNPNAVRGMMMAVKDFNTILAEARVDKKQLVAQPRAAR